MKRSFRPPVRAAARLLMLAMTLLVSACATVDRSPPNVPETLTDIKTETVGDVTVSVAILTDAQASAHFGADLGAHDVQALWMSVRNASPATLWFLRNVLDRDFYSADEAALLVRHQVRGNDFEALRQYFRDESIRVQMRPGMITEGFVFLPRAVGGRYVDVRLAQDAYEIDLARSGPAPGPDSPERHRYVELRFGFALPLPDGEFDYEVLDTNKTYPDMALPELDLDGLRAALEKLPCCATDDAGEKNGDPLNVVIVGDSSDVLNSLSRSGWSFTHRITLKSVRRLVGAAIAGDSYPVAPVSNLYLFGRKQDFALQRARASIAQRNHMRLWMAPFEYQGEQVWVGQVSRDIGIKLSKDSASLTTHIIDPEVDLTREYLLHSLLAEGFVGRFGFVAGAPRAPRTAPATNLTGDPYFSDGMRMVVILSPDSVPYEEVRNLLWERSAAPIAEGQTEAAEKNVRPIR